MNTKAMPMIPNKVQRPVLLPEVTLPYKRSLSFPFRELPWFREDIF